MSRVLLHTGRHHWAAVLAFAFLGITSCETPPDALDEVEVGQTSQQLFHPDSWGIWPSDHVDVCWEHISYINTGIVTMRENVQNWIKDSYGRYTRLRFTGWGECPTFTKVNGVWQNGTGTIAIIVDAFKDKSRGGFQNMDGSPPYGYQTQGPTYIEFGKNGMAFPGNEGSKAIVLHEFGHALGFGHEFSAPGTDSCQPPEGLGSGNTYHTPYDFDSIMNSGYCHWNHELSPWDIVSLQEAFGRKPMRTIAGYRGLCLSIDNPSGSQPSGAAQLQVQECNGSDNQYWKYTSDGYIGDPSYAGYNFVDVKNGVSSDGTPLHNWNGNGTAAQIWKFRNVELVGMGGLCLDVPYNDVHAGQTVQLEQCDKMASKLWTVGRLGSGFEIRHGTGNYCLTAFNDSLTLQTCNGTDAQAFNLNDGQIKSIGSGLATCLDVLYGDAKLRQPVHMYTCRGWSDWQIRAQLWNLRGRIVGLADKCMDLDVSSGKVQLWSCNDGPGQIWDYHF